MADPGQVIQKIRQLFALRQHGGQVQIHRKAGVVQPLDQRKRLSGAVEKVGVAGRVGLDGKAHAVPGRQLSRPAEKEVCLCRVGVLRQLPVAGAAEHQRGAVQRVGELVGLRGVVQQAFPVGGVKNGAGAAVPDALDAGHRKAPAVFQIPAEQRGGGELFVGAVGENAGGGQLQPGETRLLHGGVHRLIVRFFPRNVADCQTDVAHGQSLQSFINCTISSNSCCSLHR